MNPLPLISRPGTVYTNKVVYREYDYCMSVSENTQQELKGR